jgi:hypothetical protein
MQINKGIASCSISITVQHEIIGQLFYFMILGVGRKLAIYTKNVTKNN